MGGKLKFVGAMSTELISFTGVNNGVGRTFKVCIKLFEISIFEND